MEDGMSAKRKTVGVMMGDVSHEFAAEMMDGFFDAAGRENVRLFFMMGRQTHGESVMPDVEHEIAARHNSIYGYTPLIGADAFILSYGLLSGFQGDNAYSDFRKRFEGTAHVVLHEEIDTGTPRKSCITIDNRNGFSQCVRHLVMDHGYKRIALVSGPKEHPEARERELAYRDTMTAYGLPVTAGMIAYGDLSGFVDKQVSQLLDSNPGLEAIVFCNDEMAKAGYRECVRRGLKVGKDIAITGFDNFTTGRTMMPPLTTVSQNAFKMGRLAVSQAAALAGGKPVEPVKLTTHLHIRNSCGCNPGSNACIFDLDIRDDRAFVDSAVGMIFADLSKIFANAGKEPAESLLRGLADHITSLVSEDGPNPPDEQALAGWLAGFARDFGSGTALLAERLNYCLYRAPDNIVQPAVLKLYRVLSLIQGYLYANELRETLTRFESFRAQSGLVPEFIRDLVVSREDDEVILLNTVERLHAIALENVFICLLPEPLEGGAGPQDLPDRLLLAAYQSGRVARAYPRSQMPVVDKGHAMRDLPDLPGDTHMISFSIFSGDVQYGILLCRAEKERIPLLQIIGLQLGILLNFLDLKRKERIVGGELQNIREQNEILNFLSEYDPLCSIFNRRGFIERAIRMNRDNTGKSALCVFLDLDHLKQINDNFGHSAGDSALCAVSDILRKTVRSGDLIARIGGDEFVGLFITDKPDFGAAFKSRLKDNFNEYNQSSGKPYFVEASIGVARFTFRQGLEISKIINDADNYLYEEKRCRRPSALR